MAFIKAKREKVWLKMLLTGASGSGKSFSALRVSKGLAEKCGSRVAVISTEGSRTKYYADIFDYDVDELTSYDPESYIESIDEAISAGYQVIVIDSISHEWSRLNDIHSALSGNSFTNWGKLKPRHRAFMEKILHSPAHIICCARGKTEWALQDKNGKQVPQKLGLGAEQDKQIAYEYTVSLLLEQESHVASVYKDNTRLFENRYEVLTEEHGRMLYDWCNNGEEYASPTLVSSSANIPPTSEEDDLKSIKSEIITLCVAKGGQKNETLMKTIKAFVPSGNPNAIKSLDIAKNCLEAVKALD